jgi:cytochrome c553
LWSIGKGFVVVFGKTFGACLLAGAWLLGIIPAQADGMEEKAAICSGCHGEKGIPIDKTIPVIWGQQEGYLYLQLRDFKKSARKSEMMAPVVAMLERDDMLALAAYFAAKPWPALGQPSASDADTQQALTANGSIGCAGCHLDKFQGTGSVPRLAGQNRDYLAKTLNDFRSGTRANNPGMTSLAKATAEPDLVALENYLAGL